MISKLLRLKAYEQPPAGYAERFLAEFRRRQRAELLKRRGIIGWWEDFSSLWPTFEVPRLAYIGMAAAALVGGLALLWQPGSSSLLAGRQLSTSADIPDFSLQQRPVFIGKTLPTSQFPFRPVASQHYVLQPLPASNDQPLSF